MISGAHGLWVRLGLLGAAVCGVQLVTGLVWPDRHVPSTVKVFEDALERGTDVVYFGDSTLYRGGPGEGAGQTLPERLAERLPGLSVTAVSHDAYHPRLYAQFAARITSADSAPRVAVATVHPRAFSVERDYRPEYQFVRERWFLRHPSAAARAFFRPLAVWGVIDLTPVEEADFRRMDAWDGATALGTIAELIPARDEGLTEANRASFAALCYRYRLRPQHRQLAALGTFVRTCRERRIVPVVYFTPVDVTRGEAMAGAWFGERVSANAGIVGSVVEQSGGIFVDLSTDLEADSFVSRDFPDCYLTSAGKDYVADRVAEAVEAALERGKESG